MRFRVRRHNHQPARKARVTFPRAHNQGAKHLAGDAPDSNAPGGTSPSPGELELRASLFAKELNEWTTLDLLRLHENLSLILPRTRERNDSEAQSACLRLLARVEHELEGREL